MKEGLRRIILFTVIVITGSVMILFDVPLIILIPLILATGLVVLVLLGAITLSDITSVFRRPKFENLKKIAFLKRLDGMKFFEKNAVPPDKKPVPARKMGDPGLGKAGKTGTVSPLRSFLSSLGSLGTVLKERNRQKKKVEHINKLLDKTVGEKVKPSPLAGAGTRAGSGTGIPGGSSGGTVPVSGAKEEDPFMSLSGDEFDVSLLDGLEDTESASTSAAGPGAGQTIQEPDISLPSLDISSETDDILKNNAAGLEEFSGLEGGDSIDQDFGDLDDLNLDEIDLDVDPGDEPTANDDGTTPVEDLSEPPATATAGPAPVKTTWIASDAPRDAGTAGDQTSVTADMSAFAKGASGSDEDMLSSLAADVKHVKIERNLSLIRDLKDFKASATEIEDELRETSEWLTAPGNLKERGIPPAKKTKLPHK
jgi:hypothetical protein